MPEQIGQYELLAPIASGGMAEVWLARRVGAAGFARDVVLKRMHARLSNDEQYVRMFLDEARLTATLQHPNIAQILDLGRVDDSWFIAMEFVDGPDLGRAASHAFRQRKPLPVALVAWIVARAASGLHHAHEQVDPMTGEPLGLIHRDVSHANVLLSRHGDVKVIDFGIAQAHVRQTVTRVGVVKGKPGYLSPEQIKGEPLDGRVDVFALGVMLWELLTGQVLFRRAEHVASMERTLDYQPPPPSTLREGVSAELDAVVLAALEKDAAERIPSAAELARRLDACVAGELVASRAGLARWIAERTAAIWPPESLQAVLARRTGRLPAVARDGLAAAALVADERPSRRPRKATLPRHGLRPGPSGGLAEDALAGPPTTAKKVRRRRRPGERPVAEAPDELPPPVPVARVAEPAPSWRQARTPIRRDNLVRNREPLVGRVAELRALENALSGGDRLLTLTGPAGVGKSRLAAAIALRSAPRFADHGGTWRCSLANARSLEDACRVVAAAIGLPLANAGTADAAVDAVGRALAGRGPTLLWLDDAGVQRAAAAVAVSRWLASSARLIVVATARSALGVRGEHALPLGPLDLTGGVDSDAGHLLRARLVRAGGDPGLLSDEPALVRRLLAETEGVPLAVALAAAQLARGGWDPHREVPPPPPTAARAVRDSFVALSTALRGTWSQLAPWERAALLQVSVLRGGFDHESAAAVLQLPPSAPPMPEVVAALRERSLLRAREAEGRFAVHDSVRSWLEGAGAPDDADALRVAATARRDAWGLRLAERCASAARSHDGARARATLALELDNLLPIHADALARGGADEVGVALRVAVALFPLLLDRGPLALLARLFDDAVAAADALPDFPHAARLAQALALRAEVQIRGGSPQAGLADAERALALASASQDTATEARAWLQLSDCHRRLDHATRAMRAAMQARTLGHAASSLPIETEAMHLFGCVYYDLGDRGPARRCFEASLAGAQRIGDRHLAARARANLGCIQADLGELTSAEHTFAAALDDERTLGNLRGLAVNACYLGLVAQERGQWSRAAGLFERATERLNEVGDTFRRAYVWGFAAWNQLEAAAAGAPLPSAGPPDTDAGDPPAPHERTVEEALAEAEENLALTVAFFVDKGDRKLRAMHFAVHGWCLQRLGHDEDAAEAFAQATEAAEAGTDPVPRMVVRLLSASRDALRDPSAAPALAREVAEAVAPRPPANAPRPALSAVSSEVRFALRLVGASSPGGVGDAGP